MDSTDEKISEEPTSTVNIVTSPSPKTPSMDDNDVLQFYGLDKSRTTKKVAQTDVFKCFNANCTTKIYELSTKSLTTVTPIEKDAQRGGFKFRRKFQGNGVNRMKQKKTFIEKNNNSNKRTTKAEDESDYSDTTDSETENEDDKKTEKHSLKTTKKLSQKLTTKSVAKTTKKEKKKDEKKTSQNTNKNSGSGKSDNKNELVNNKKLEKGDDDDSKKVNEGKNSDEEKENKKEDKDEKGDQEEGDEGEGDEGEGDEEEGDEEEGDEEEGDEEEGDEEEDGDEEEGDEEEDGEEEDDEEKDDEKESEDEESTDEAETTVAMRRTTKNSMKPTTSKPVTKAPTKPITLPLPTTKIQTPTTIQATNKLVLTPANVKTDPPTVANVVAEINSSSKSSSTIIQNIINTTKPSVVKTDSADNQGETESENMDTEPLVVTIKTESDADEVIKEIITTTVLPTTLQEDVDMAEIMVVPKVSHKISEYTKVPEDYENYDLEGAVKAVQATTKKNPAALLGMFGSNFGIET
ncbi:hypothetical protein B566_EDAN010917 [Ephemera danica]|nr:hypothetical protein B566_EDAN010917 [Ephemera danica]